MSVTEETEKIYNRLKKRINHPYVETVLQEPFVDRDKLTVYYLLFQMQRDRSQAAELAMDLMAAEIGLFTHEKMTNEVRENKEQIKHRQLVVLSGDYYSSLYYYSLAQHQELKMVRWVSEAIQRYNVSKCALFYSADPPEWPLALGHLLDLESALISYIATQLGLDNWASLLKELFFARRLHLESAETSSQPTSLGILFMNRFSYSLPDLRGKFKLELEKVKNRFNQLIEKKEWESTETSTVFLSFLTQQMRRYSLS
ncbi:MAG: heptaprenyl diphosphate synthase component 1 [Sporolactobacillus sp.]